MRHTWMIGASLVIVGAVVTASAHEANLPAGPIRDRHELMEKIGKNAKIIGDAMKAGKFGPESGIVPAAQEISTAATKITGLFPPGSTDPKSRAKAEIWTNWKKFEEDAKLLQARAAELANEAAAGGNVPAKAQDMFAACKSCHDDFRIPEKEKKK
jgi:cytochrome c556